MSRKPTLVFIPGGWHIPKAYDKVIALLEPQQYKCVRVALPTTDGDNTKTFKDDVDAARNAVVAETAQDHDVVIVAHSYGGVVGSSVMKGLTRIKESQTSDQPGHVIGLVLLTSGFAVAGMSFLDGMGGKPPDSWKADTESGYAVITSDPRQIFYHDLPEDEGTYWVSKLTKQSLKALTEGAEHTYEGWKEVPCWYLAATDDQVLPPAAQKYFVQLAKDAGVDVTMREIDSGHSPMLSKPKETVDFILDAIAYFVK